MYSYRRDWDRKWQRPWEWSFHPGTSVSFIINGTEQKWRKSSSLYKRVQSSWKLKSETKRLCVKYAFVIIHFITAFIRSCPVLRVHPTVSDHLQVIHRTKNIRAVSSRLENTAKRAGATLSLFQSKANLDNYDNVCISLLPPFASMFHRLQYKRIDSSFRSVLNCIFLKALNLGILNYFGHGQSYL